MSATAEVRVSLLDGAEAESRYRAYLRNHPAAMLYYTLEYRDLLREQLGCEATYLTAVDATGRLCGILPTMTRHGRHGAVLNSLPFFGSHGGVLADTPAVAAALWHEWDRLAATVAAATVILNPFAEQQPPITTTHQDLRIGSMTTLPAGDDVEGILDRIDSSARRNYHKAMRSGVDVREENDAVDVLHEIHVENMTAVDGRAKERAFFRAIGRHFVAGTDFKVYTARYHSQVAAALLVFFSGTCVEYFTPATRLAAREVQPSAALLVRAMQDAARRGYRLWNWGGSWVSQEGVARFKGKWGGSSQPYKYLTRINATDLLRLAPAELLAEYPNFYVYPFAAPGQS